MVQQNLYQCMALSLKSHRQRSSTPVVLTLRALSWALPPRPDALLSYAIEQCVQISDKLRSPMRQRTHDSASDPDADWIAPEPSNALPW